VVITEWGVLILQVVMHSTEPEHTCGSETCLMSSVREHEMIGIKEENTSVVTAGPVEKAEHEVNNYVSLCAQFKPFCRIKHDCIISSIWNCLPTWIYFLNKLLLSKFISQVDYFSELQCIIAWSEESVHVGLLCLKKKLNYYCYIGGGAAAANDDDDVMVVVFVIVLFS